MMAIDIKPIHQPLTKILYNIHIYGYYKTHGKDGTKKELTII